MGGTEPGAAAPRPPWPGGAAWVDGRYCPIEEAKISVLDLGSPGPLTLQLRDRYRLRALERLARDTIPGDAVRQGGAGRRRGTGRGLRIPQLL